MPRINILRRGHGYSADCEAKVALEASRGDLTLAEVVAKHGVLHTMIAAWKRPAIEGMPAPYQSSQSLNE